MVNGEIPPELDAVIARMLAKDPDDRYQDACEARKELSEVAAELELEDEPAAARKRKKEKASRPTAAERAATGVMNEALTVEGTKTAAPETDATRTEILQFTEDLERESAPKRGRIRRHWKAIAIGGGAVILAGLAVLLLFVFGVFERSVVKVPYLINLEKNVAIKTVRDAGLQTGSVEEVFAYEFASGRVSKQRPNDGTKVPRGSKVNIEVSLGNKVTQVPKEVIGAPAAEARATLTAYQFKVKQEQGYSTTIPVGCVIATRPAPGTLRAYGDVITMIVNTGVRPKDFVEPPQNGSPTPAPGPLPQGSVPLLPRSQP